MEDWAWRRVVVSPGWEKGSPEPGQFLIQDGASFFLTEAHFFLLTCTFFHLSYQTVGQSICFSIHLFTNFNNSWFQSFCSIANKTKQHGLTGFGFLVCKIIFASVTSNLRPINLTLRGQALIFTRRRLGHRPLRCCSGWNILSSLKSFPCHLEESRWGEQGV